MSTGMLRSVVARSRRRVPIVARGPSGKLYRESIRYTIRCGCGYVQQFIVHSRAEGEAQARAMGWKIHQGLWACRTCRRDPLPSDLNVE